jgi:hypothetical protein
MAVDADIKKQIDLIFSSSDFQDFTYIDDFTTPLYCSESDLQFLRDGQSDSMIATAFSEVEHYDNRVAVVCLSHSALTRLSPGLLEPDFPRAHLDSPPTFPINTESLLWGAEIWVIPDEFLGHEAEYLVAVCGDDKDFTDQKGCIMYA